jgi:hypothetical protein
MTKKRSAPDHSHLCQFQFADGRKCRMLRREDHATLCVFHARAERQLLQSETLGPLLSKSPSGEFLTAADVNHVLGKLFAAISEDRLPPRNAATLAFVGQLLLHSIPLVKHEMINASGTDTWRQLVRNVLNSSNPSRFSNDPPRIP